METARTFRVVGAGLQTIRRLDVAPIVDAVAAQPILAISIATIGAATFRRVRLANAIETWCGAAVTNGVTDLTAIAMIVGGALHTTAVGIADQTVRALVIVATGHAMVAAANRTTGTIRAALTTQHTGVTAAVTGQGAAAIIVVETLHTGTRLAIAHITRRTTGAVGKATRRTIVFKACLAAVAAVVVAAAAHTLVVLTTGVAATARILPAAILTKAGFTNTSRTTTGILCAGLPALIVDAALPSKAIVIVGAATRDALVVDAALALTAGVIVATTFSAVVFQTDLTIGACVVIWATTHALSVAAKGPFTAGP